MAVSSPPNSLLHRLLMEKTRLREDQDKEKLLLGSDRCSLIRHLKMAYFGNSQVFVLVSETSMNFLLHLFLPAAQNHKAWVLNRGIHQYNVTVRPVALMSFRSSPGLSLLQVVFYFGEKDPQVRLNIESTDHMYIEHGLSNHVYR